MLFCYGICNSIIHIISAIIHIFRDSKIHCLMCVNTYSLNCIHFPLWTLIDSFIGIEIVHGIFFDISRWYHHIWCILYTNEVITGNTMWMLPGSAGVASSPNLSVSLEGMGCEPVLNLAATTDEAVSIICTFIDKIIPSTFGRSWCMWPILLSIQGLQLGILQVLKLLFVFGFFDMVDLPLWNALSKWHCSWRVLINQCVCQYNCVGLGNSTHACLQSISDCYIIKRHIGNALYCCWTIKALVVAEVLYDGFTVSRGGIAMTLIISRPSGVSILLIIIRLA